MGSKVSRFFYVKAPAGKVFHLHFGKLIEGEVSACGRRLGPHWKWWRYRPTKTPVCKVCVDASPKGILVARVRK